MEAKYENKWVKGKVSGAKLKRDDYVRILWSDDNTYSDLPRKDVRVIPVKGLQPRNNSNSLTGRLHKHKMPHQNVNLPKKKRKRRKSGAEASSAVKYTIGVNCYARKACMCRDTRCAEATERWYNEYGKANGIQPMKSLPAMPRDEKDFLSHHSKRPICVQAREEKRKIRALTLKFFNMSDKDVEQNSDLCWSMPMHLPHWVIQSVNEERGPGERFKLPRTIALSSLRKRGAPLGFQPDESEVVRDSAGQRHMLITPRVKFEDGLGNVNYTLGSREKDQRLLVRQMNHRGSAALHEHDAAISNDTKSKEEKLQTMRDEYASQIADLQAQLVTSEANLAVAEAKTTAAAAKLNDTVAAAVADAEARAEKAEREAELYRTSGLNRHALCDSAWHNAHPDVCKNYFGFPCGWKDMLTWITSVCFPDVKFDTMPLGQRGLSKFEQCIAVRFWMRTGWKHYQVAQVWGVCPKTFSNYLSIWMPRWGNIGRAFARLPLTRDYVLQCQPAGHISTYGMPISLLIDGKDVPTDTDRGSYAIKQLMCSSKLKSDAIRFLWGSMPHGLVVFCTDCFLGRVSEKRLVQLHASWLDLHLPIYTGVQLDRGFNGVSQWFKYNNQEFIPSAKNGRARMHPGEVFGSYLEAKNRYTIEVCFARLIHTCAVMGDEIPHAWLKWVNDVMLVGAFSANLMKPLKEPESWGKREDRLREMIARHPPLESCKPETEGEGLSCDSLIADYIVFDTPARQKRIKAYEAKLKKAKREKEARTNTFHI